VKIYNEIVFDVDGNVTYEDSFEYSGNLILCKNNDDADDITGFWNIWEDVDLSSGGFQGLESGDFMENFVMPEGLTEKLKNQAIEWGGVGGEKAISTQKQASDIQLNPLPSLPSVSNVGTVNPTGAINWNAIPGGFQPLPQVAGNRKKLYQISKFHGGINQKSSPRDISDAECQEAKNVTVSNVGRITLLGDCMNENNTLKAFSGITATAAPLPGYGLFEFTAPADWDEDNIGEYRILLTSEGDQINALDHEGGHDTWIDFANSGDSDTNVAPVFYAAGNGVYVCDANLGNSGNDRKAKIYVSRNDLNGTVAVNGWVAGDSLLTSPSFHDNNAASTVSIETGAVAASNNGEMAVQIEDTGTGTWNATYYFYVSYLFDGGCETGLTPMGPETFSDETLEFNVSIKHHTTSYHLGGDKRIEGARIYFKESGTAERFLLAEISLIDGVKGALDSTFTPWDLTAAPVYDLASDIIFTNPPEVYSYASLNGYYANEIYTKSYDAASNSAGPVPFTVRYKTAVIGQQGNVFIGNVTFDGKHMPDSMMFCMPGKPGIFPKYNKYDSPSSDGSPITALAAYNDVILQFRQNAMYVINVSNPSQFYTQEVYRNCGVINPCQVFTCAFGVIFVNKFGCYLYDGRSVISLASGKFDWGNQSGIIETSVIDLEDTALTPSIGYDPRSQSIIVLKNIGNDASTHEDDGWVYNMLTQSWTEGVDIIVNAINVRYSNFIVTSEGYLSIKANNEVNIINYNHDKSVDTGAQTITYQTKDLDFGLPTQTKKLFKVYITYKGTPPSTINYRTDGSSTVYGFTETNWAAAAVDDYEVATLVPDDATEAKGWKSISIYMTGAAGGSGETFEINDISILYRVRPIK
jgi:hypothetical protein